MRHFECLIIGFINEYNYCWFNNYSFFRLINVSVVILRVSQYQKVLAT